MLAEDIKIHIKQTFTEQGQGLLAENSRLLECIQNSQEFYQEVIHKVFNGTDIELFTQIATHHDLEVMHRHQAVRRHIQLRRHEISAAMTSELVLTFLPANWADQKHIESWHAHGHTIDMLVSQQRELHLAQLKRIERLLPAIVHLDIERVSHHLNPFDPGMFYRVFLNGIQPLRLEHWVEAMMLRRFHDVMTWNLGALYEKVLAESSYQNALSFRRV